MEPLDNALTQVFNTAIERSPRSTKHLFEKLRDSTHVMNTGTTREQTIAAYGDYREAMEEITLRGYKDKAVAYVLRDLKADIRRTKENFWRSAGPT